MPSKYTPEDRFRAATAMVTSGNSIVASKQTGIPGSTLRHWSQHDADFQTMCQEVWCEHGQAIKSNLAQIVKESGEQVLDRIRNGDVVRDNKTGELVRVPIKGRDAAIVGAVAFDKHRLILNQPTSISRKSDDIQSLAKMFTELSQQLEKEQIHVVAIQEESEEIE